MSQPHCNPQSRHYAGSHMTSYGGFSLWHGMESYLYRPITEAHLPSRVLSTLRANGYQLRAFDASGLTSYSPPVLRTGEFDSYQTYGQQMRDVSQDEAATRDFVQSFRDRDPQKPYLGFVFLYATHEPYYSRRPEGSATFESHTELWQRYLASAQFVDEMVGKILEAVGPDTVFVFTGDHGEEFGEFGGHGHAAVRFEDVRTRVPLIFCLPGQTWPKTELSAHADIWPTLFQWMGVPDLWRRSSFTGRSLRDEKPRSYIPLTGTAFPSRGRELAIVLPREGKLLLHANGNRPYHLQIQKRLGLDDTPREKELPGEREALSDLQRDMKAVFH